MSNDQLRPSEFNDIDLVLENGAKKHGARSWERFDCLNMQTPMNHDSMFHHLARSLVYHENRMLLDKIQKDLDENTLTYDTMCFVEDLVKNLTVDKDSELNHDLHLACRAMMSYTRNKRLEIS